MTVNKASINSAGGSDDSQYTISGVLNFDSVPLLMLDAKELLKNKDKASISLAKVEGSNSAGLALMLDIARLMQNKTIQFTDIPQQLSVIAEAYGVSEELKTQGLINT